MDGERFDRLTKRLFGGSRRRFVRALLFSATAIPLTPVRIARSQQGGMVAIGGSCSETSECQQNDMQRGAICADNGFLSDGDLNCCIEAGCCQSDVDCCAGFRCVPTYDVCNVCMPVPIPTRFVGQLCESDHDCVPYGIFTIQCLDQRCTCVSPKDRCGYFTGSIGGHPIPDIPESESALAFAARLSLLETVGQFDELYDLMHPDAKAIIPREAVTGWFAESSPTLGAEVAVPEKVRFIAWEWPATGKTYRTTADVAYLQVLADGTIVRDEVRLVKDPSGNWGWFFGRDRAFVEEQIARYG